MFLLDEVTVGISAVVLFIAVISPFVNLLVSRLRDSSADEEDEGETAVKAQNPGISVVMTVDDELEDLKVSLPALLKQKYEGDFQIIVVACGNNPVIEDTLKMYSEDKHLYTTFIPASSRYMSRKKLAVTLGVKAAKYEWIMMTDVDCCPVSETWLAEMSENCTEDNGLVVGFSSFEDDYKASRRFDHVYMLYRQLRAAQKGNAWGYCGNNLMFRKSSFISGKGYDGNLKYVRGEYDFLVNKYSGEMNVAVELSPDSRIVETELTDRGWRNKCLYYMAIRKKLNRSRMPRFMFNLTMAMMALGYVLPLLAAAFSVLTENYILLAVSVVSLLVAMILRSVVLSKSLGKYIEDMSVVRMLFLEMSLPLRNAARLMKYMSTDKYDFICHKV